MRPFQLGDKFRANEFGGMVEVRWVDPRDRYCAVVFNMADQLDNETVFAADFCNDWTLVEEGAVSIVPQ